MDTLLLRTFLEVTRTRHFSKAAKNLHVAPSTVSTRIRQLEQSMELSLLERNHQKVTITPAGERLIKHARLILGAWERAHEDMALSNVYQKRLVIAGVASLWDIFLQDWLNLIYRDTPSFSLRAEQSTPLRVVEKLDRSLLDLGFLYEQPKLSDMQVEQVQDISLTLVSDQKNISLENAMHQGYIRVEWGRTFTLQQETLFPEQPVAAVRVNSGRIALDLILAVGGAAYLPQKMVASALAQKQLFKVKGAPIIPLKAYAVYSLHSENIALIRSLLDAIPRD